MVELNTEHTGEDQWGGCETQGREEQVRVPGVGARRRHHRNDEIQQHARAPQLVMKFFSGDGTKIYTYKSV